MEHASAARPVDTGDRARQILVLVALGIAIAGIAAGALLIPDGWWALSWVGYAVVGGVVLLKRPRNVIGLLLLAVGLSWSVNFILVIVLVRLGPTPDLVWLDLGTALLGSVSWLLLVMIPTVFPTGRPTDRLTRTLRGALFAVLLMVCVAELVSGAPKEETGGISPLAIPALDPVTGFILNEGFLVIPLLLFVSLLSLGVRWRRAVGPERLQYGWFVWSLAVVIGSLTAVQFIPDQLSLAISLLFPLMLNVLPVAIGVAVLRYRLYEIDRIFSRTVGYVLVVGILALVYVAGAIWLPSRFVGGQPDLFVAGATLAAAASFGPLRRRILDWVDRRFYRSRYDAEILVAGFARDVRNEVDVDRLAGRWISVVSKALQPATAGIWVRKAE